MSNTLSRRKMLGLTAGAAAGASWVFALNGDGKVVRAQANGEVFVPTVLTNSQVDAVAKLCETIIPRTDTPGAIDARVPEYIDVRLSGLYPEEQRPFVRGLTWLEGWSSARYGRTIAQLSDADLTALLNSVSDENEHLPANMKPGADFFALLKGWTIHGYYTSREGRVETLGLPESQGMQQWVGCTHSDH